MKEFLENLVDYITVVFDFIGSFFHNLIQLIAYIPATVIAIQNAIAYLPPFLSVPIYAGICLSLIIAILNKWG